MKKRPINIIQVKVSDKFEIEDKLDFEEEIEISYKGEIVKKDVKTNQDGTVDVIYYFKPLIHDIKYNRENK